MIKIIVSNDSSLSLKAENNKAEWFKFLHNHEIGKKIYKKYHDLFQSISPSSSTTNIQNIFESLIHEDKKVELGDISII